MDFDHLSLIVDTVMWFKKDLTPFVYLSYYIDTLRSYPSLPSFPAPHQLNEERGKVFTFTFLLYSRVSKVTTFQTQTQIKPQKEKVNRTN